MEKKKSKTQHALTGSFDVPETAAVSKEVEEKVSVVEQKKEETAEEMLKSVTDYDEDQVASIMEQILNLAEVEKDLELMLCAPPHRIMLTQTFL